MEDRNEVPNIIDNVGECPGRLGAQTRQRAEDELDKDGDKDVGNPGSFEVDPVGVGVGMRA